MAKIILITGGTRSGKSYNAMKKALSYEGKRLFIATATACDNEMEERIRGHRMERGDQFTTIEAPYALSSVLESCRESPPEVVLVDCMTVWIGNLMYRHADTTEKITAEIDAFINTITDLPMDCIFVTNEVGLGIVPDNEMAREFRDLAGTVNRRVAERADEVYVSICGIQMKIK